MALTHILAAIRKDAADECARIAVRGTAERARLIEAAEARALERERAIVRRAEEEAASEAARRARMARAEGDEARRAARGRVLQALLAGLGDRLARLREDEAAFRALTEGLLREALALLPDAEVVLVDRRDEGLVRGLVADMIDGPVDVRPTLTTHGGVWLERGGVHRVMNTLESRCEAAHDALIREAVRANRALREEGRP
jgi:vacuolar-type H+-ATPase subunit E/Vma4